MNTLEEKKRNPFRRFYGKNHRYMEGYIETRKVELLP